MSKTPPLMEFYNTSHFLGLCKQEVTDSSSSVPKEHRIKAAESASKYEKGGISLCIYTDASWVGPGSWSAAIYVSSGYGGKRMIGIFPDEVPADYGRIVQSAELYPLILAMQYAKDALETKQPDEDIEQVVFFNDCSGAIGRLKWLFSTEQSIQHEMVEDVIQMAKDLIEKYGVKLICQWVPGHEGLYGNQEADRLARAIRTGYPVTRRRRRIRAQ